MQVIPVIDIRGGEVVAAVRGDRAHYRPIESPLVSSVEPVTVAQALYGLFPFDMLYVADLDGIEGRGADFATQRRLADVWRGRELWIDDGASGSSSHLARREKSHHRPRAGGAGEGTAPLIESERIGPMIKSHVVGSESLTSLDDYEHARALVGSRAPLSLDFRGDVFVGPPELLDDVSLWPKRIIVMTLARVGSGEGPDLARLSATIARAKGREVYAAGGVRNADDLRALAGIGAAGALISTALHAGRITRADLDALTKPT